MINEAVLDWAYTQVFGPEVNSYNRSYALADVIENASTSEKIWTVFNMGAVACDSMPTAVEADILAVLCAQEDRGTDFLSEQDALFYESLPTTLTLYRGAQPTRRLGMAWTTDINVAELFARGHRGANVFNGMIYRAHLLKSEILSVSQDRGESTILLNPAVIRQTMEISVNIIRDQLLDG